MKTNVVLHGDCLEHLRLIPSDSVDMAFADPPFNLNKKYNSYADRKNLNEYLEWCKQWLREMVRVTKPTGSIFVHNIPKWLTYYASFLNDLADFKHWIAWDAMSTPLGKSLMPTHYGILFYAKDKQVNKFYELRQPHKRCRKCNVLDFMRNNFPSHHRKRRLRCRTRQFCKLHAISMAESENSAFRFRNTSLTIRERLTPEMECSTRTRTREIRRLRRFSAGVSLPLRGFFSAGTSRSRAGHSPERRYLCESAPRAERQFVHDLQSSCLASFPHTSGSSSRFVWFPDSQSRHSYRYAFSCAHCSTTPVFERLLGVGGVFPCRQ